MPYSKLLLNYSPNKQKVDQAIVVPKIHSYSMCNSYYMEVKFQFLINFLSTIREIQYFKIH